MLLRFDTFKIAFPNLYLDTVNYSAFAAFPSRKHEDSNTYYLANPAPGIIDIRIGDTETAIEFSAKILKANYPDLLSTATIEQALENLLAASPFTFKVADVLRLAHVLKAHQAHHFTLSQPFAAYTKPLANLHVNREYRQQLYKDETLTYLQNAVGKGREYFKIYDKAKEYALPCNAAYRNSLTAAERKAVAAYYANIVKAETEINGKRKLRQHFPDIAQAIMLTDLLQSTSNPLATQFAEITKEAYAAIEAPAAAKTLSFADTLTFDDGEAFSNLERHGFDLEKIYTRLKALNVPTATQTRKRKKYAALLASYLAYETDSHSVEALRELKVAISSPPPITISEDSSNLITPVPAAITATGEAPDSITIGEDSSNLITPALSII